MKKLTKVMVIFSVLCVANSLAASSTAVTRAQALLAPTKNNNITGTVTFYQFAGGVKVVADITGLQPGEHGFHINEWGDCSAPDASSAGGHFNPTQEQHGAPNASQHHVGDLGNLVADANGKAHYEWLAKDIRLNGADSILGRSIIVHTNTDDLHSQPSGKSGDRVACGVIGAINPFPEKN